MAAKTNPFGDIMRGQADHIFDAALKVSSRIGCEPGIKSVNH